MKKTNGLLIVAAVILGLAAIYWLIQGFGLMFSGASLANYSFYIILSIIMIVLLFFSRRRALLGGIILSTLGVLLAVYFLMVKLNIFDATPFLLLMCVPLAISGLLFIEADWSTKRNKA
jgi:hypothetical protein